MQRGTSQAQQACTGRTGGQREHEEHDEIGGAHLWTEGRGVEGRLGGCPQLASLARPLPRWLRAATAARGGAARGPFPPLPHHPAARPVVDVNPTLATGRRGWRWRDCVFGGWRCGPTAGETRFGKSPVVQASSLQRSCGTRTPPAAAPGAPGAPASGLSNFGAPSVRLRGLAVHGQLPPQSAARDRPPCAARQSAAQLRTSPARTRLSFPSAV
jgi:hypothetical protein